MDFATINLKMPRYANTGAFQIDTIRDYDIPNIEQNQYITVLYEMHLFLRKGLIFFMASIRKRREKLPDNRKQRQGHPR